MMCPLEGVEVPKKCIVQSCMYWSALESGCGYIELHGCNDIEMIAAHKGVDIKDSIKSLNVAKVKSKLVLILDEYLVWVEERFRSRQAVIDQEVSDKVTELLLTSVLCRLPTPIYVWLVPYVLDQDVLDEFTEQKSLGRLLVEELVFDLNIKRVRQIFATEQ